MAVRKKGVISNSVQMIRLGHTGKPVQYMSSCSVLQVAGQIGNRQLIERSLDVQVLQGKVFNAGLLNLPVSESWAA